MLVRLYTYNTVEYCVQMLNTCTTYINAILACRRYNFPGVELQRRYRVVVLQRLEDTARAEIPDL